jgi:hypothetical protein
MLKQRKPREKTWDKREFPCVIYNEKKYIEKKKKSRKRKI